MAHKVINGKAVVDWTTGDPEGDRITLLAAYRDFLKHIKGIIESEGDINDIYMAFVEWGIDTENQIDEVPRTWIKRPE